MKTAAALLLVVGLGMVGVMPTVAQEKGERKPINVDPPPIASDATIKYDYDIVYVRAPRRGDDQHILWAEVFAPLRAEPGSDLVLLHPDGSEEVLVAAGDDAITDPFVSFDAEWVYYARYHNVNLQGSDRPVSHSSDIFKIHVKTKKVVQLTQQVFTPNTGVVAANLKAPGVYNLGPCPLPGGKVMFTSNRNGFASTKNYKGLAVSNDYTTTTQQLFVMDDDGSNVEMIGHLNINGALHPTILKDGRVMFTSFETQGLRDFRMWAIWTIHPDGTNWAPLVSALGPSGETAYHFMTQLSDGHIVFEEYYFQHDFGFGTLYKMALLVGMHDYDSGLDMESFTVTGDFPIDDVHAGQNLAAKFRPKTPGVWELPLTGPIMQLPRGQLTVAVKDRHGNLTRLERTFSVGTPGK